MEKTQEKQKKVIIKPIYFIIFFILYLELMFKALILKNITLQDVLYTSIFSIPKIIFLGLVCNLFKEKISKITTIIVLSIITFYFLVQVVFFKLFSIPFSFSTLGLAEGAFGFTDILLNALKMYFLLILVFIVPLLIYIPLRKKMNFEKHNKNTIIKFIAMYIITVVILAGIIKLDKKGIYSLNNLYYKIDAQEKNIKKMGLLTATKLDIKRTLFGFEDALIIETIANVPNQELNDKEYGYNMLEIDFEALRNETKDKNLISIYDYMQNTQPSMKNEYTGYFKDKNLIFILAEGFNSIAVDKELTPTLYKLTNSGFIFNNFYSPVFLSTTGGEFQATTGLIPTQTTLKLWKENKPKIQYALGHSFSKEGYTANAYHNWTYTYYTRENTMKTLGFDSYMGIGNGLEKLMKSTWLPSDIDMINATTDFYINEDKFLAYYITVSGHAPYVLNSGNSIAFKNRELVKDLEYSSTIKAYLATQIELDRALEALINKLEEAGGLDNTVIALVRRPLPIHYTCK